MRKTSALNCFERAFRSRNGVCSCRRAMDLSPEIYPLSGLVGGLILLIGIRRPTAMHKILLAEDDNDMRRFLVKALENAGFQVSPHDNGLSAYQRLREEPFEMLLTDIVMPEMDGIELARRASELDPDIKIMFITGFAAVALNSDSEAPEECQGAVQAGPSSRIGQRSEQDAGGLISRLRPEGRQASLPARFGADIRTQPVRGL